MKKTTSLPPEPKIEPHWVKFKLPLKIGSGRNFTPGESGIRMAFYQDSQDKHVAGRVWFGEGIEGPPHHVHGGVSAYVLDEAMGSACWLSGYAVVAATLEFNYLNMTPIGVDLLVEARVMRVEGREVFVDSRILDDSGKVYTEARGRFFRLQKPRLVKLLAQENIDYTQLGLKFIEDGG
jgi:acyl-coenzyme A thioesterase PaaI-like protein